MVLGWKKKKGPVGETKCLCVLVLELVSFTFRLSRPGMERTVRAKASKHRCTGEWHRPLAPSKASQPGASSWWPAAGERQQQQHLIQLSVSLTDKPPRQATIWMTKYERSLFWGDRGPCFSPIGTLPFCHSVCFSCPVPGSRHAFCYRSEDLQVARHTW